MAKILYEEKYATFGEPGFVTLGDPYKPIKPKEMFNASAQKGKQFLGSVPKAPSALPAGFFQQDYKRVMEGEAYSDPVKERRAYNAKKKALNKAGPFIPSNGPKSLGGKGANFNTFSPKLEAFSPADKPAPPYKSEGRNFLTNPPKQGTFGVPGTTFTPLPEYVAESYDAAHEAEQKAAEDHKTKMKGGAFKVHTATLSQPFHQNPFGDEKNTPLAPEKPQPEKKKVTPFYPGKRAHTMEGTGNVLGTLDKYPAHSDQPPLPREPIKPQPIFRQTMTTKTGLTRSVVQLNAVKRVTANNYHSITQ